MKISRKKITVTAHHNVEDFRPYVIHFKDRGGVNENKIQALKLAIAREANWSGWFDEDNWLEGKKGEVNAAIVDLIENNRRQVVVPCVERDKDEVIHELTTCGFVIWYDDDGQDIGFGLAFSQNATVPVTPKDTDRYENKWVLFA